MLLPHWLLWNLVAPFMGIRELARVRAVSAQTCAALMWNDAAHEAAIKREFQIARIARYAGSISLHYSPAHVVSWPLSSSPARHPPLPLLTQLAPLLLLSSGPRQDHAASPESEH